MKQIIKVVNAVPFKKNDEQTKKWAKMGGKSHYDISEEQLDKMRKSLSKYILLVEKKELTKTDTDWINRFEKYILKTMDKLHASKSDVKMEVDKPIMIL